MSTFVIVPGAWDTPLTMEPVIEPLRSAGHEVVVVDLPCGEPNATLDEYADAVRAVLPADLADVVLVGYSFGGFAASKIAVENPEVPVSTSRLGSLEMAPRYSISSPVAIRSKPARKQDSTPSTG